MDAWATAAFAVRDRWRGDRVGESLSIPTWFYGHEPTNVFGTPIAKYFANALREDTLLHRCRGGIVFAPGAAGTVQEIFQAANDRFYALRGTRPRRWSCSASTHWTRALPAWPLLQALAEDSPMAGAVARRRRPGRGAGAGHRGHRLRPATSAERCGRTRPVRA